MFATPEEIECYYVWEKNNASAMRAFEELRQDIYDKTGWDCHCLIGPGIDGNIFYDSRFNRSFSGDQDILHRCIEDNIFWNEDLECEDINWDDVSQDYDEMIKRKGEREDNVIE